MYSDVGMRKIIRPGTEPVSEEGRLVGAGRQLQPSRPAKFTETRAIVEIAHRPYPVIASVAISLYTNGAAPKY